MSIGYQNVETLVCRCYGVTESEIRASIERLDAQTVEDITGQTCAGNGCTACHFRIRRLLNGVRYVQPGYPASS